MIVVACIGLIFSLLLIVIIIFHRKSHTVTNLLLCELCFTALCFYALHFTGCYYGTRQNWSENQPLCTLRAYLLNVTITSASYSFFIQSISRLFFTRFYNNRTWLTWRTHWILIVVKYLVSFLIAIVPFFYENGFGLVEGDRMCMITMKTKAIPFYTLAMSSMLPTIGVISIYSIILHEIRLVAAKVSPNIDKTPSYRNAKRNLKILQQLLILLSILACGATPYLILCFWNLNSSQRPPDELYFISLNFVVLSATIMLTVSVFMNKKVKDSLNNFTRVHI
ncbi:unnamed protein product [Adineta ricciae]|uniref:G-protein coupled receptors family 1 profile domain-containing protein n=1 Tax=Adineta ricciae TaxID=249248 RepID=A0A814HSL2_ADIRI|nr:unnamed protein product [Adineta ricciae]CAF1287433.1 unnamed protein product [Adineta ricciae]